MGGNLKGKALGDGFYPNHHPQAALEAATLSYATLNYIMMGFVKIS
jgi:hypothetical protein